MITIKVGYCIAYDWHMLQYSIPQVYEYADVICLSIDINRLSWSGSPFSWDEEGFRKMVTRLDVHKKIEIYEDNFCVPSLRPMENEVRQRNKMADFLGRNGWHVQLDADEYFVDFRSFTNFLKAYKSTRKVNINCPMINLYKTIPEGTLWIKPSVFQEIEYFPIATRYPNYEHGRRNGYFDIKTNFPILHQSWARGEEEIWEKLNNWGHAKDFDVHKYFTLWQKADKKNYLTYKDFHHLYPKTWPALELQERFKSIEDLMHVSHDDFPLPITLMDLKKANSIWLSRAKKALRRVMNVQS